MKLDGERERRIQKLVRRLTRHLELGELCTFEEAVEGRFSRELLLGLRQAKALTRGPRADRERAASIIIAGVRAQLSEAEAEEYARYALLCHEVAKARDELRPALELLARRMPRLSMRQLLMLASRTVKRSLPPQVRAQTDGPLSDRAQQYARRLHDAAGRASDLWFAVVRAVNVCSEEISQRDLRRPDAIAKAIQPFNAITTLCSQLNALDYALDSASFGDFYVSAHDPKTCEFKLDIVDVRRLLLRVISLRGRLMQGVTRRKEERFLRKELRKTADPVLSNALVRFAARRSALPGDAGDDGAVPPDPPDGRLDDVGLQLEVGCREIGDEGLLVLAVAASGHEEVVIRE